MSEVSAETVRRAAAVHPIVDLQIGYSLLERRLEGELLDTCRALVSLIDSVVEQLSQVFMLRVFHVGTIC